MDVTLDVLGEAGSALISLLTQPFYYIGILFVILQIRRHIYMERKLFHVKLHSFWSSMLGPVLWGWLAGLLVTIPMLFLGSLLQPSAVLWLWGTAIVLSLFRIRFLCFAYAAGILGLVHFILGFIDPSAVMGLEPVWLGEALGTLYDLHIPSLFALVAVTHLAEALLMKWQGTKLATPLFMEGKRGRLVGAYQLQGFWPVPIFLMVPTGGGLSGAWTPLFGGSSGIWADGWMLLAFPMVLGFTELTAVRLPDEKIRRTAGWLFIYSMILLAAGIAAELVHWLILPAAVFSILMHELMVWVSRLEETAQPPRFVHDTRGLCVLSVIPGGPAHKLGIQTGEVIHKCNGMKVNTKEELHQALRINSAFVKLEVLDLQGESKFMHRALYEGEHHQLGIVLAPDQDAQYYVEQRQPKLFSYLIRKMSGVLRKTGKLGSDSSSHGSGNSGDHTFSS